MKAVLAYCLEGNIGNKGENYLRKAVSLDSNNSRAYYHLGWNYKRRYWNTDNPLFLDTARTYYLKAISKNNSVPLYWFILGETYQQEGITKSHDTIRVNPDKVNIALDYFRRTVALDSTYAQAYYSMGYCYQYLGDTALAWVEMKKACALEHTIACFVLKSKK